jgi:hypothetical protein
MAHRQFVVALAEGKTLPLMNTDNTDRNRIGLSEERREVSKNLDQGRVE